MGVSIGSVGSGLPAQTFTNTNQTVTTNNVANGASTNTLMNQFAPGQQALQGQAANFISNILAGGQVPQSFGLPQAVYDAAFANFNKYQAPQLAAQNGAGSPAINASMQELQLQLAGLAGQRATGNALDAFNQAANFALNPIGSNAAKTDISSGTQVENAIKKTTDTGVDYGGLLAAFANMLPGGGFPIPPSIFGNT